MVAVGLPVSITDKKNCHKLQLWRLTEDGHISLDCNSGMNKKSAMFRPGLSLRGMIAKYIGFCHSAFSCGKVLIPSLDCSHPLYFSTDAKKKASANAKHEGMGATAWKRINWSPWSLPFCTGVPFSRDSIRAFNAPIKIREKNRAVTSLFQTKNWQSTTVTTSNLFSL